jgi:hypothetical protein
MFEFLKALVLGAILSFVVSAAIGHAGSTGGLAHIHHYTLNGFHLYWSWVLFVAATALAFVILIMMD